MTSILPQWTKPGSWSMGRDPLGIQATSVRLYRSLIPGLTNVTNRLRYYSFYCWVIDQWEQTRHSTDLDAWAIFIRRAEALYALACYRVDPDGSDGLAGGDWAGRQAGSLKRGKFDVRPFTDSPGEAGQYLKAKRGNFGQFYIASMLEVGLLTPSKNVPLVSPNLGKRAAEAFASSCGAELKALRIAIDSGKIDRDGLESLGEIIHPSRIPPGSEEMSLLRAYLLAEGNQEGGRARRDSAWLFLDLMSKTENMEEPPGFEAMLRHAFYNGKLPDGSDYNQTGEVIDRWRAYQANEYCHVALETLLNALVSSVGDGIAPGQLLAKILKGPMRNLRTKGRTWASWAQSEGNDWTGREYDLAKTLWPAISDDGAAPLPASVEAAISLVATLWTRWRDPNCVEFEEIQTHAGENGSSLVRVIRVLDDASAASVEEALIQMLRRCVLSDHLAIAGRKLAASGNYTYHFTMTDGLVSEGKRGVYAYTSPRIWNLRRFLRDAGLQLDGKLTPHGRKFLHDFRPC